jgi:hypothetical protein
LQAAQVTLERVDHRLHFSAPGIAQHPFVQRPRRFGVMHIGQPRRGEQMHQQVQEVQNRNPVGKVHLPQRVDPVHP